jgi:hypothetical protein
VQYRVDETWHRLREWTYGQMQSERLAAQILMFSGYWDLDPTHPLGGPDGRKDAMSSLGKKSIMAVYFPRGQKTFSTISDKFQNDLEGARINNVGVMAFVTNQELKDAERQQLKSLAGTIDVDLFHLERLTAILDSPDMESVRKQFLGIDFRSMAPFALIANAYHQAFSDYNSARPAANGLVTKRLPPDEYLFYLEHYNFRSGRVPIDKQHRIAELYQEIAFVQAVTEGRNLAEHPDVMRSLQSHGKLEVLSALPALGFFQERLKEHYLSIQQVTATELGHNPTHLGIFTRPEEINPNETGFSALVFEWESTARALASAYRVEILGESGS